MNDGMTPRDPDRVLAGLARVSRPGEEFEGDTPAEWLFQQFTENTLQSCRDGLLAKTSILRVEPGPARGIYEFELDAPYKRKLGRDAPIELMPGPIRGVIQYRDNMFANRAWPYAAVQIDPTLGYLHANVARHRGSMLCLGEIPAHVFPIALDLLLENHVYPILTYQNRRPAHPFDLEAARYFATDPTAMDGLEPARPLY